MERAASELETIRDLAARHHPIAGSNAECTKVERSTKHTRYREALRCGARSGVAWLDVDIPPRGPAIVQVDRQRFRLPRELAVLLEILAAEAPTTDGIVGWKSTADILKQLRLRLGKEDIGLGALNEKVRRLRLELLTAHVNPFLVQTDSILGKRFALRCVTALVKPN